MIKRIFFISVLFLVSVQLFGQTFYSFVTSFKVFDSGSKKEITYAQLKEKTYRVFFSNRSYGENGTFLYDILNKKFVSDEFTALSSVDYFIITHGQDTMMLGYPSGGLGYFDWKEDSFDSTQRSIKRTVDTVFFKKGNYIICDSNNVKGRIVKYKEMKIDEDEKEQINRLNFIEAMPTDEKEDEYINSFFSGREYQIKRKSDVTEP